MNTSEIEHVKNSLQAHQLFISLRTVEEMEATIRAQAEALKIATEALEAIAATNTHGTEGYAHDECILQSSQALARIKEEWK